MRAIYALIGLAQGGRMVADLLQHAPTDRGVITSLLAAMCLLALVGVRYPRQMLPMLLFEFAWKTIWLLVYGLPQRVVRTAPSDLRRRFPRDSSRA